MDKLIINESGQATISNDGATIMKLLDIVHPAARTLVDIAKSQDAEVGDGTTSVVLLAGSFLKECKQFVEDGVHPQIIIRSFRKATSLALARLKVCMPCRPSPLPPQGSPHALLHTDSPVFPYRCPSPPHTCAPAAPSLTPSSTYSRACHTPRTCPYSATHTRTHTYTHTHTHIHTHTYTHIHTCHRGMQELAVKIQTEDPVEMRALLEKCAATTLSSKMVAQQKGFFSKLVVDVSR